MSSIIFKSKLLREEIKHWILVVALFIWGVTATVYALSKRQSVTLIDFNSGDPRIIETETKEMLEREMKRSLAAFINSYYSYDSKNHLKQMDKATNYMSYDLFESLRENIMERDKRLSKDPLVQSSVIEKLDLIGESNVEGLLTLTIQNRMAVHFVKLKINIELTKRERTSGNPRIYEISSITDQTL